MNVNSLLNKEDRKRKPLGELSTNSQNTKRLKPQLIDATGENRSRSYASRTTPFQKPSIVLPPLSHFTSVFVRPSYPPDAPPRAVLPVTPSRSHPVTVTLPTSNTEQFLYGVQNSRKNHDVFFNITSSCDFQKSRSKAALCDTPSKKIILAPQKVLLAQEVCNETGIMRTPKAPLSRRSQIWFNDASVIAATEFKMLYLDKGSSSFLKREYQAISDKLNIRFNTNKFTETAVRNRKGLFQSLCAILAHIKGGAFASCLDGRSVPHLPSQGWKDLEAHFESAYVRKLRTKTDNTDLEIISEVFKRRPRVFMKNLGDIDDIKVQLRQLVKNGQLRPSIFSALLNHYSDGDLVELLQPVIHEPTDRIISLIVALDLKDCEATITEEALLKFKNP